MFHLFLFKSYYSVSYLHFLWGFSFSFSAFNYIVDPHITRFKTQLLLGKGRKINVYLSLKAQCDGFFWMHLFTGVKEEKRSVHFVLVFSVRRLICILSTFSFFVFYCRSRFRASSTHEHSTIVRNTILISYYNVAWSHLITT